jgi:hypothetical protein
MTNTITDEFHVVKMLPKINMLPGKEICHWKCRKYALHLLFEGVKD